MVFFWTDTLFFILLAMLAGTILRSRSKEHLRRPWRKVARSHSAMISVTILVFYLGFAILDSIHFHSTESASDNGKYKTEALSLLDWWASPLRLHVEKTYSAPFAAYGYVRENIRGEDGVSRWIYPRLLFGSAHLNNPEAEQFRDILLTSLQGLAEGFLAWGILIITLTSIIARANVTSFTDSFMVIARGKSQIPWRAVFLTLLILILAGFSLGELSLKYHVFGTDKVGGDVFFQSLKSVRTGLLIGMLTTFVTLPLALSLGILAGYYRGWVDDVIQYIYTTLNSIPGVLLIAASMLLMQAYMTKHEDEFASLALRADFRLLFLCVILGLTSWTSLCRLLRAETLKLREMDYVQAARALGVHHGTILMRHILPNLFHLVLISVTLDFSSLVLAEAVLSYVNIGVDPTTESWGNMINSARLEMAREPVVWWSLSAAFVFMFVLVLAANLFADAVRDAFDPRRVE